MYTLIELSPSDDMGGAVVGHVPTSPDAQAVAGSPLTSQPHYNQQQVTTQQQ